MSLATIITGGLAALCVVGAALIGLCVLSAAADNDDIDWEP